METIMSHLQLFENFKELSSIAKTAWENNITGSFELEPYLLDILNFTKKNLSHRSEISQYYIDILNDYRKGPLEIVTFSMRELQWDEVKQAAIKRMENSDDPRVWSAMSDVLAVYEDDWDDADLYKYYSDEED